MLAPRHYAGVLVTADPPRFDEVIAALGGLDGIGTYRHDPVTGRCVAVLESADRAGQERLFCAVQAVPGVRSADLVYHLVDPECGSLLILEEPVP